VLPQKPKYIERLKHGISCPIKNNIEDNVTPNEPMQLNPYKMEKNKNNSMGVLH
jgi:hypothetical protein